MKTVQFLFLSLIVIVFNGCKEVDDDNEAEKFNYGSLNYNGFVYRTIVIGNQEWTVDNLRTTAYNDGSPILKVVDGTLWTENKTGAFCAYSNDEANVTQFGYLYNWYAVNSGKLAPSTGNWRVPTDADWTKLIDFAGKDSLAGEKLKSETWPYELVKGKDEFGFNGLPGGFRDAAFVGFFDLIMMSGYYWCSTAATEFNAWVRVLRYDKKGIERNAMSFGTGYSVRLVRDR